MADRSALTIKISGENGQGLSAMGELLARTLKREGGYTYSYREYPSLIMGGIASHQVEVSDHPVQASSQTCDVLVSLSRFSLHHYLRTIADGGVILHSVPRMDWKPDEKEWLTAHQVSEEFVEAEKIAQEVGTRIMSNTVLFGVLWQVLGLKLPTAQMMIKQVFADKPQFLDANIACLSRGFQLPLQNSQQFSLHLADPNLTKDDAVISGNELLALGAVAAGVRAYYGYPMTPTSSLLTYMTEISKATGILAKQIDDEISVAEMAIGGMFMGTRVLIGTSGGGFDLMTESLSLAGMTETPFVCVLGQRPGPATGLPTWTSASDLNLAVYGGHGEFPRAVLALSDAASAYTLVQHALNIAERWQLPVILLTEKNIGESLFQLTNLPENIPIQRGLVPESDLASLKKSDRYRLTDSGISPRWLPGSAAATFVANSDEHLADGSLTEEGEPAKQMYDKRLRKLASLADTLPEPVRYGPADAEYSFVGWGSVKNTVLDAMAVLAQSGGPTVNYLHFEYLWPLKTAAFRELAERARRLVLIENNALGQLGGLLTQHTEIPFWEKFLKYDGRPFFVEEILNYVRMGGKA